MFSHYSLIFILLLLSCKSDNQQTSISGQENEFTNINHNNIQQIHSEIGRLQLKKEPIFFILPNHSIRFQTNSGSEMLLRVINTSTSHRAKFYINGSDKSILKSIPPNMPDSSYFLINNWEGSQLLISNVTDSLNSATISVLLVGN